MLRKKEGKKEGGRALWTAVQSDVLFWTDYSLLTIFQIFPLIYNGNYKTKPA